MRPTLTVVDASRVLMEHGPVGGNPADVKPVRTIAAGFDPVALDAWACTLFGARVLPASLPLAAAMGLGRVDLPPSRRSRSLPADAGRARQPRSKCGRSSGIGIDSSTRPAKRPSTTYGTWWMILRWPPFAIV